VQEKRDQLLRIIDDCRSLLIGYSGGVDSVFLAALAVRALGRDQVLAVTGRSASLPSWMEDTARRVARDFDIPWREVATEELQDPQYAANPSNRCYFCKSELWSRLGALASDLGFATVADGANADDAGDHRPGAVAGIEQGVRSPLLEAGLTKSEIRQWSRELGLPTWDQPAAPCLASRIPYGTAVTEARLRQVERAEEGLRALGFRDIRVRYHGGLGRVEASAAELPELIRRGSEVHAVLLGAGFDAAAADLLGYRRGALNESLRPSELVPLTMS
jgi:pyridinium-3,5-biscarboxylic acid mononucleotide sulfurtransferase